MQEILAGILITAASAYLIWMFYRKVLSNKTECDGCVVYKLHKAKSKKDQDT